VNCSTKGATLFRQETVGIAPIAKETELTRETVYPII
jgi:hypothetical protein